MRAAFCLLFVGQSALTPPPHIQCPSGTTQVDAFQLNGTNWTACEDLQVPGGAIALVDTSGRTATEWFAKTHEVYGSAPSGSDDDYYLNFTKQNCTSASSDVLGRALLDAAGGDLTWQRVASALPPIRRAGVRATPV